MKRKLLTTVFDVQLSPAQKHGSFFGLPRANVTVPLLYLVTLGVDEICEILEPSVHLAEVGVPFLKFDNICFVAKISIGFTVVFTFLFKELLSDFKNVLQ